MVANVSNEEDVGPDSLRRVCLIEAVGYPTVLCQRRSFRQGDAGSEPRLFERRGGRRKWKGEA